MHSEESTARPECIKLVTRLEEQINSLQATVAAESTNIHELDNRVGVIEALQRNQFEILRDVTKQVGDILIKLTKLATHTEDFEQQLLDYRKKREQIEERRPQFETTATTGTDKHGILKQLINKYPLGSGMLIGMFVILIVLLLVIVEAEAIRTAFTAVTKRIGGG